MTKAVLDAIESADILLGASRMIAKYSAKIEKSRIILQNRLFHICMKFVQILQNQ